MADVLARWLAAILSALGWFFTGELKERNSQNERTLDAVSRANRAAADGRNLSFDERVRLLRKRGRVRGL